MPQAERRAKKEAKDEEEGELLGPLAFKLTVLAITITLTVFTIGLFGLLVLVDVASDGPNKFNFVTETEFGELWKRMTEKNPFFATIFVNGGLVTSIFFGRKLHAHRLALKAEAKRRRLAGPKKQN